MIEDKIQIQLDNSLEFEFDEFTLNRVSNHWEIAFEDEQGLQSIIIEEDSFNEKGELLFDIDGKEKVFTQNNLKTIEEFCISTKLI